MLVDLIKKNNEALERNAQETREREERLRKSLKEELQENREEGRIFRAALEKSSQETRESLEKRLQETNASLERNSQETRESLKEDLQEIKTSQMKMEDNLKKEMQELQERLKMDIDERERKLQRNINQVQGDVEKVEEKLTKKIEDDVEETKAELGERINKVETNCNHRIAEVAQMQKQCNEAVNGIGEKQRQWAVNLRDAVAIQLKEDNKRVEMEVKQLQQGVQHLESKTEEIDRRISNATLAVGEDEVRSGVRATRTRINLLRHDDGGDLREDLLEERSEIPKEPRLPMIGIKLCGLNIEALVDTGSEAYAISKRLYEQILKAKVNLPSFPVSGVRIVNAVGAKSKPIKEQVLITFEIEEEEYEATFLVVTGLNTSIILGIDWLNEVDAVVSFDEGTIKVKGRKGEEKRLKFAEGNAIEEEEEFRRINLCHEEETTTGYGEEEPVAEVLIYLEGLAREDRYKEDKIRKKLEEMTHLDERAKKKLAAVSVFDGGLSLSLSMTGLQRGISESGSVFALHSSSGGVSRLQGDAGRISHARVHRVCKQT
ncbi:calponin homology domain-containing protein DDB_G0272472-like [Schistocerca nitens]|uniref:calponin homology domain-containing protein DDB_G0272472-like n=1 Tax=Schistocerca nitens TaxID=7011 RepID=UPI0021197705|nr:calponin homology domain-containing protein DDB_G0272472-like [Schistocerca nitens]